MGLELKQLGQNWQLYAEFLLLFLLKLIAYTVVTSRVILEILLMYVITL